MSQNFNSCSEPSTIYVYDGLNPATGTPPADGYTFSLMPAMNAAQQQATLAALRQANPITRFDAVDCAGVVTTFSVRPNAEVPYPLPTPARVIGTVVMHAGRHAVIRALSQKTEAAA